MNNTHTTTTCHLLIMYLGDNTLVEFIISWIILKVVDANNNINVFAFFNIKVYIRYTMSQDRNHKVQKKIPIQLHLQISHWVKIDVASHAFMKSINFKHIMHESINQFLLQK
jgi:hypothetical protein